MGVLAFPISRACEPEIQVNNASALSEVEVRPMIAIAILEYGWRSERRVREKPFEYPSYFSMVDHDGSDVGSD